MRVSSCCWGARGGDGGIGAESPPRFVFAVVRELFVVFYPLPVAMRRAFNIRLLLLIALVAL